MDLLLTGPAHRRHRHPRLHARLLQQRGPARTGGTGEWFLGYPAGAMAFFQYLDRWRSNGDFEGLEFR